MFRITMDNAPVGVVLLSDNLETNKHLVRNLRVLYPHRNYRLEQACLATAEDGTDYVVCWSVIY